jgi:pimeloyl-ACP methyl ester carboxylesterase
MQTPLFIPVGRERIAACLHLGDDVVAEARTSRPWVVCCHGLTGTRFGSSYRLVQLARQLSAAGIACVRFDFRGCGESDGRFEDLTLDSVTDDLRAVLAYAFKDPRLDTNRFGLVASSFAALTTSRLAAELPALRCLVFHAPVADAWALVQRDMPTTAWALLARQGWIDHRGLRMGQGFFKSVEGVHGPSLLVRAARPLLVYHAEHDREVPSSHGMAYVEGLRAAGVESRIELLAGADHGLRDVVATERIIDGTVAWLHRFLQSAAPRR